jgi:NADPH-dependent 2,4-dienoyl-CoA reductase/sulfur reductase-like enzyme
MTRHERHPRGAGIVIAGGGLAAQRAVEALRRHGHDGTIQMVSDEAVAPYDRPPLSKAYLAGDLDEAALRFRADDWYRDRDVDLLLGERAAELDLAGHELMLASGSRLRFSQLLIATGSSPRRLPATERFSNVHELRSLPDARRLRDALSPDARVVVIGAGFIGQEVAATARATGARVTVIEAAPAPLAAVLGVKLGGWFARLHRDEGIDVHVSARIANLHGRDGVEAIELQDGRRFECDVVVVGIGTVPATAWLAGSGLDDGGVPVDAAGRTHAPDVYVAGDAAKHYDARLGSHTRTEHWEAAARQGAAAARAMLGLEVPPAAAPSFWSDQHGIRIQYVGHAHGADDIRIDGDPDARDFTATFADSGRTIGALLVGRPHALAEIRRQIEHTTNPPESEAA